MAISYKLTKETGVIKKEDEMNDASIPFDPDNTDYKEYLEWVAEGNTPDPAD
tara:strand:- start:33 stop:188 length:156 start_codon:yes stop_codon:yes gene_type:complete